LTKIFSLELLNYRIFAGRNRIEFGTAPRNQVTIITGGAGSGKSTFLNAISWCLYGREGERFSVTSPLIASAEALHFEEMYPGDYITTSARMEVGEKGHETIIERKLITKKTERGLEKGDQILAVSSFATGTQMDNPEEFIESCFPRRAMESLLDSDHAKSIGEVREVIAEMDKARGAASLPIFISERPHREVVEYVSALDSEQQMILLYDDGHERRKWKWLHSENSSLWLLERQPGISKIVRSS